MRRMLTTLLLVCATGAQALLGQTDVSAARITPGARVRVTIPLEAPRTAVVVARTTDTLILRWTDVARTDTVPFAQIARLELSTNRHRSVGKSAGWGALIGAGAGAILGVATYSECDGFNCIGMPNSRGEGAAYGAVGGGVLGAMIGSLVGLKVHEDWERVSIAPRLASFRTLGTGLGVTLEF